MKTVPHLRPSAAMRRALTLLNNPDHQAVRANINRRYSEMTGQRYNATYTLTPSPVYISLSLQNTPILTDMKATNNPVEDLIRTVDLVAKKEREWLRTLKYSTQLSAENRDYIKSFIKRSIELVAAFKIRESLPKNTSIPSVCEAEVSQKSKLFISSYLDSHTRECANLNKLLIRSGVDDITFFPAAL